MKQLAAFGRPLLLHLGMDYELVYLCLFLALALWGSPLWPCGPMAWTGLAFTASFIEIALPKIAFWEEEYYLAHCTVGEVIALPPGLKSVTDKMSEVRMCVCMSVCLCACVLARAPLHEKMHVRWCVHWNVLGCGRGEDATC